ncbi:hypothetical protein VCV18_004140 [Metarhizium anisopliae]
MSDLTLFIANASEDVAEEVDSAQAGDDTGMYSALYTTEVVGMEIDSKPSKSRIGKKRIDKRKQKKSSIVFAKYSDKAAKKKKGSR